MTTPQGPSRDDGSEWARPGGQGPRPQQPSTPSESPTRQIPQGGRAVPPPPNRPRPPGAPPGPPPRQGGPPPRPQPPRPGLPPNPQPRQPGPSPVTDQPTTRIPPTGTPANDTPATGRRGFFGKNRMSIGLVVLIVVLVLLAGLIGAELYTRHLADSKVASAVSCEVQDSATVSFAGMPPVLWQYLTSHYRDISVQTGGNQVRSAKGMKVNLNLKDIRLSKTSNSDGTIGSLNGTITWSSDGIRQSIQDAIPVLGQFVTSKVTTNPGAGTVELKGLLDSATVKPQIVNNGLSLQVVSLSALGSKMSTDTVQKNLDDLTSKATQNYPLGIHADNVKVTDSGVQATFSSSNATIPASSSSPQTGGQDCFANL